MSYVGWDGREYEDVEMDNMRERPRRNTNRTIESLQRDARELERLARVLGDEGLDEAARCLATALEELATYIDAYQAGLAAMTPQERLRDLLS